MNTPERDAATQLCEDGEGEGPDGSGLFRKCRVLAGIADITSEMAAVDEEEPVTFTVERLPRSLNWCEERSTLHQRDSALVSRGHSCCCGFGRGVASQC